jgi:hypothetical protein
MIIAILHLPTQSAWSWLDSAKESQKLKLYSVGKEVPDLAFRKSLRDDVARMRAEEHAPHMSMHIEGIQASQAVAVV